MEEKRKAPGATRRAFREKQPTLSCWIVPVAAPRPEGFPRAAACPPASHASVCSCFILCCLHQKLLRARSPPAAHPSRGEDLTGSRESPARLPSHAAPGLSWPCCLPGSLLCAPLCSKGPRSAQLPGSAPAGLRGSLPWRKGTAGSAPGQRAGTGSSLLS